MIGQALSRRLLDLGHQVRHFSRTENKDAPIPKYFWNPIQGQMDTAALDGVHIIVHLAGASLADSWWTKKYKKVIVESRTKGTELIASELKKGNYAVEHYISASGVGYYGAQTQDHIFSEDDGPYPDFLSKVCQEWEAETEALRAMNVSTSILRTGVVLSKQGGAIPKLSKVAKYYIGSPLGTGNQWMPWIHIDDLCEMYVHVIEKQLTGVFNANTNDHQTNRRFTKSLCKAVGRPMLLPSVPSFAMRLLLGERAVILLEGSRTSADKILDSGFKFQWPKLDKALQKELS